LLSALLAGYYSWRAVVWKKEVGGWWDLALGRKPPRVVVNTEGVGWRDGGDGGVREKIDALASALGVPSKELASAIAEAVRSHVPPASLSSVAQAEGTAVNILLGEGEGEEGGSAGIIGGMASGLGSIVGLDEPLGVEQDEV